MLQPWHEFTVCAPAYAFPPQELLPHVVRKILLQKPAVLLVVWIWSIPGLGAAWHELPKRLHIALHPAQIVLRPGPMFPAQSSLPHGMLQAFWMAFAEVGYVCEGYVCSSCRLFCVFVQSRQVLSDTDQSL